MITDEELERLAELCEAATAGPWVADERGMNIHSKDYEIWCDGGISDEDLNFIAATRDAMPRLIAEVERLRGDLLESHTQISLLTAEVGRLRKLDKTW